MTILLGVDIQDIDEVCDSIERFGNRYVERVYTSDEIDDCFRSPNRAAQKLAGRFAAKEAVLKVLKEGAAIVTWKEIEVRSLKSGQSVIELRGFAAELATQQGITTICLSISHGGGYATAVVVAEKSMGSSDK